jgi:integrase
MAHVRKLGKRRWQARYRSPGGREHARNFSREKDASTFVNTIEADKARGLWIDPRLGKTPVKDFAEQWLDSRINIRAGTMARDESLVRNHIVKAFGGVQIGRLRKADVQTWVKHMSAGYAPATVRKADSLLGAIMAEAVDHRMIAESPCRRVKLPRTERVERRYLSPEEVRRLAAALPDLYRALILTASYLGPRWEELAGLKREHLNLLRREMRIVGTIERTAGTYRYTGETKTKAARRTLRLPAFLVDILGRHLETAPPSDYVFPAAEGGFLRYDNFRTRIWDPAVKKARLGPLTFHELRHTAAAIMIDEGSDPLQI